MLRICMRRDSASIRRIQRLSKILNNDLKQLIVVRANHDGFVKIGQTEIPVTTPKVPQYVPYEYLPEDVPQSVLHHLRWIAQKDLLGQDVFLIGPPGPLRRILAMQYLELTRKEAEYISLSRDTTENDLKQRREMRSGSSFYIDQCAVKAAIEGRVLVLEGIEKAERNVLPALNNLLENREMQLDDGRFLMHPKRYDQLLQDNSKEKMDEWKLVRVNENFRVFAIGLPVPKYRGNPLDPPLRSRFQARDVYHLSYNDQLHSLYQQAPSIETSRIAEILSCATTLVTQDSSNLGLPDFPLDNLTSAMAILEKVPTYPTPDLLSLLYPYHLLLNKEGKNSVEEVYQKFNIHNHNRASSISLDRVEKEGTQGKVDVLVDGSKHSFEVACNNHNIDDKTPFISTDYHTRLLTDMLLTHSTKDFCIIGGKGCGKTSMVREFANMLSYRTEPLLMYQDMTSRDLLQQRYTLANGDTVWKFSPLIQAAIDGSLAVLDGLNRVNAGTLSILQRLVHDREITLHDGMRLIHHEKFNSMRDKLGISDQDMNEKSVYRIHPSFRMIALAEPPKAGTSAQQWLNSELLTLFMYHHMTSLTTQQELTIINGLVPNLSKHITEELLSVSEALKSSKDANAKSLSSSLSTRQLIRISRRLNAYSTSDNYKQFISNAVHKACLSRFLPPLTKHTLTDILSKCGLPAEPSATKHLTLNDISCEVTDGMLRIDDVKHPVYEVRDEEAKIPDVLFYDNAQHLMVMKDMLQDYQLGEHILLVGNQGVGKNKIVDRFLQLLNKPREYLQLHRDTTVQSLTVQPAVRDGIIVYEDSALVRAVRYGHALVVDEADKAPIHVTCVLKSLLESGRATLADGRKIVTDRSELANLSESTSPDDVIMMHPDFRMFVLANRPGFPFLGNDFFSSLGDVFSCHAVDNPSVQSELDMLQRYGPSVPLSTLNKLVAAFAELRDMSDRGLISYPYSTREVVNIVKHLEKFPDEGIASVVKNVFDFDAYKQEAREQLSSVMHKHGIPVGAKPNDVHLSKPILISKPELTQTWKYTNVQDCHSSIRSVKIKGPVYLNAQQYEIERIKHRGFNFTEEIAHWQLPQFYQSTIVSDMSVATEEDEQVLYVATVNPHALYRHQIDTNDVTMIDLYDVMPSVSPMMQPRMRVRPMGKPLEGQVALYDEKLKVMWLVDSRTGSVRRVHVPIINDGVASRMVNWMTSNEDSDVTIKMCSGNLPQEFCSMVLYEHHGNRIFHVNLLDGSLNIVETPEDIVVENLQILDVDKWLVTEKDQKKLFLLETVSDDVLIPTRIREISIENLNKSEEMSKIHATTTESLNEENLSKILQQSVDSPNRLLVDDQCYARCVVGLPDLKSDNEVYTFQRKTKLPSKTRGEMTQNQIYYRGLSKATPVPPQVLTLPSSSQVVRVVSADYVPQDAFQDDSKPGTSDHYMEVADLPNQVVRYIAIPSPFSSSPYVSWQEGISESGHLMTSSSKDERIFTSDTGGVIREWETGIVNLRRSLTEWRNMIGSSDSRDHLQITREQASGKDVTAPKHGKIDADNTPHVGGNTWAGGTGGRDTAGLGGKGGPYRLDAGHDVTQIPDWEKEAVPEHVKQAAREMGQKAFKERLREIRMSEYDAQQYNEISNSVKKQVTSLRIILDSLQAKKKERHWAKHQTTGELDDMKLIEGLTGEKNIYKKRADEEPEPGSPQEKPKLVRLVVDVSGSMYRFNGVDQRLQRCMESACLVMEAFDGYKDKLKYDIWGHSGDGYDIQFSKFDQPPENNKERLKIMKEMHAHAQFCMSGDNTLSATRYAVKKIKEVEGDEHFVIILSDANLQRYGIRPKDFAEAMTSSDGDDDVNTFAIFIGSLGDQAERLKKNLPSGRSFVCLDTKDIPQIMQQIFTSSLLQ